MDVVGLTVRFFREGSGWMSGCLSGCSVTPTSGGDEHTQTGKFGAAVARLLVLVMVVNHEPIS